MSVSVILDRSQLTEGMLIHSELRGSARTPARSICVGHQSRTTRIAAHRKVVIDLADPAPDDAIGINLEDTAPVSDVEVSSIEGCAVRSDERTRGRDIAN